MSSGCGCKEVYIYISSYCLSLLLLYTPLVSFLFGSSIPTFLLIFLMFFVLVSVLFL